ncbi:hypothetical protein RBB50_012908 [Rhinocladiella similis]
MATVEVISAGQEGPGHHAHSQDVSEITATVCNADPTSLTRPITLDASTPQTQRRSSRARKPTERTLNIDERDDEAREGDGEEEETDTRQKAKGKRGRPPQPAKTQPGMDALAPAIAQPLRLAEGTGRQNETILRLTQQNEARIGVLEERNDGTMPVEAQLVARVGQLEDQTRILSRTIQGYGELIQKYESKIEELLKISLANADQIRALETQSRSMMKLIKDSANEHLTECCRIFRQPRRGGRACHSFWEGGQMKEWTERSRNGWKPNMEAVRATIRFAKATGRLKLDPEQRR